MKKVDENKAMVNSQTKEIKHHADELSKVLGKHKSIESWVVGKIERASTDLSDVTHYLDGKKYAKGGNIPNLKKPLTHEQFVKLAKDKGYKNLDEASKGLGYRWNSENWIDDRIKPFSKQPKYAKGGGVESEINKLYKKSKFINDDFNWKLKLLEMLQDNSIDAYNIYQTLTKEQKEQVLQEQYEVDNDMGSDGDGDMETSKENLQILLEDAKNGKKYANGGGVDTIGFIPMDLEEKLALLSRWGGTNIKGVIGYLNAMIDSGVTDNDLVINPTKNTRFQRERAVEKKLKEIWEKIEPQYKGNLKGNMYYSTLKELIGRNYIYENLLQKFKPFRKYQKFADGGGVGFRNIDKIKSNIGEVIFDHISSLTKPQLEKQLSELKSELKLVDKKSTRYSKLKDEEWYILYRLERVHEFKYAKGGELNNNCEYTIGGL